MRGVAEIFARCAAPEYSWINLLQLIFQTRLPLPAVNPWQMEKESGDELLS